MTTEGGSRRRSARIRRLLDRLAELLKHPTRPGGFARLVEAMKTEEQQKEKARLN